MDIVKVATEWAKEEIFSAVIFIIFGIVFTLSAVGFWQLGKTDMAKAFIFPTLIVGVLLLSAGIGFYISNQTKMAAFQKTYDNNPSLFLQDEIARVAQIKHSYESVAFKVFPVVIALAALLIVFMDKPILRASCIMIISFLTILLLLDSQAHSRIKSYQKALQEAAVEH